MYLPNAKSQQARHSLFDASGTITTGGTAQLLLPESKSRAVFIFENLSTGNLFLEFGGARATTTLTSGVVTGFTITNAGFGYTFAPEVHLMGGGPGVGPATRAAGFPDYPAPGEAIGMNFRTGDMALLRPAKAHAVLTSGAVSSFQIEDGGAGYQNAPYVFMCNNIACDVFGCALPSLTSGLLVSAAGTAGSVIRFDATACPTDPVAVFGATTGQAFTCKWMI